MKSFYNTQLSSKKRRILAGCISLIALGIVINNASSIFGPLSKFTTDVQITAQNAATNWSGDTDNTYRSLLPTYYTGKLDLLTVAILKKGSNMSDEQFKSYLDNLSIGISNLSKKSQYENDKDIQNILGFLIYEINTTKSVLGKNIAAGTVLSELATVISTTTPSTNIASSTSTAQVVSSTQTSTIVTPTTTSSANPEIPVQPNSRTKIHGVNFKVEGYDLSKSNYEYDFSKNTLKSKTLGITFDFNITPLEPLTFDTILATEDYCRSKGRGYRLPKTYELKNIHALRETINGVYSGGNGDIKGFYRVTQTDVNYNFGIRTFYIPDFVPLDILPEIASYQTINNTAFVAFWWDRRSNFLDLLGSMRGQYLVKGDNNDYFLSRPDMTTPTSSYTTTISGLANFSISNPLCVYE